MAFYLGEQIYNQMNTPDHSLPTIEFGAAMSGSGTGPQPFESADKHRNLSHIFNKDQIEAMIHKLGKSIYFTHVFTELAKARRHTHNFQDLLKLDDPAFQ